MNLPADEVHTARQRRGRFGTQHPWYIDGPISSRPVLCRILLQSTVIGGNGQRDVTAPVASSVLPPSSLFSFLSSENDVCFRTESMLLLCDRERYEKCA